VIRSPAVSGMFYSRNPEELRKSVKDFLKNNKSSIKTTAVISPHAGHIYSGKIAALSFNSLKKTDNYFLIGPNHTGLGSEISVFPGGEWETPLGRVRVNEKICKKLVEFCDKAELDELAHIQEHSLEVLLPFLQLLNKGFSIIPIIVGVQDFNELKNLGNAIQKVINFFPNSSLIVSSDFSHFVPVENAKKKDFKAIKLIEKLRVKEFYEIVLNERLSICGFAPIVVAMECLKGLGFKSATLLGYDTSATVTKDNSSVVAYASIAFQK
jgi:hypothetical protein